MNISVSALAPRSRHLFASGLLILLGLLWAAGWSGCRKSPTGNGPEPPVVLQGSYVGNGNLGTGRANLLITLVGPDSLGRLTGAIRHRGAIIEFDDANTDSESDTLWFRYRRDNVLYRIMALPRSTNLALYYLEPAGIPVIRVNKELGGYNLSGQWTGRASSAALQIADDVAMDMDQNGQLFIGTADAPSYVTLQMQINSGVAQGDAFQLAGNVYVATVSYSVLLVGNYFTRDSVRGVWQAGQPDIFDHGEFVFGRTFQ